MHVDLLFLDVQAVATSFRRVSAFFIAGERPMSGFDDEKDEGTCTTLSLLLTSTW
jgi:hypothetical protein